MSANGCAHDCTKKMGHETQGTNVKIIDSWIASLNDCHSIEL